MKQISLFACLLIAVAFLCGCKTCRGASAAATPDSGARLAVTPVAPLAEPGWTVALPGDQL